MIDSDDDIEPQTLEYIEHKKRREQRKKEKMQLLDAKFKLSEMYEASVSNIEPINLVDVSKPKVKNRRKIRAKRNCDNTSQNYCNKLQNLTIDFSNLAVDTKNKKLREVIKTTESNVNKQKKIVNNETKMINGSQLTRNEEKQKKNKKSAFNDYLSVEQVKEGLDSNELLSGFIRINPKDFRTSYISNPKNGGQDIVIFSVKDRNRALEGDNVVVKLKEESEWKNNQKTGYVVFILEKIHPRTAVGGLKLMPDKNERFALFVPRDFRLPRMKIPFTDWPPMFYKQAEMYEKVLFYGKIVSWSEARYAEGTILENLGLCDDIRTETIAILKENCLNVTPYQEEIKQFYCKSGGIDSKEYENRLDLRKECVFTIDPLTARDLDDAVSCKSLPNGNFEIGVHISDVSYYLEENTPLDKIVSEKATSIYMVESVYHMLPKDLCMICSLLPGEDKLTFSVFWEMTPQGDVISHKFSRTVINSCAQLAYEHAQEMIENRIPELPTIHNGFQSEDLTRTVLILHKLAVNLRENRYESGALRIDQPKVMFSLDYQTCLPTSYCLYENKECHRLIEEFMLLANITVARKLKCDYPDIAFLRSHPAPHDYMMQTLKSTLEKVGIHLDVSSAGGLQRTLQKYTGDDVLSQARMLVLNLLSAKVMTRANYFCTNNSNDSEHWHYALSVPLYTHFTSPIRRFADVIVHRQLAASLGYREKPNWTTDYLITLAANCNKQKYNAKRAGEQSIELYMAHFIHQNQPFIQKAVVFDVRDNSFDAIVIANGFNVRIYLNTLDEGVTYKFLKDDEENENEEGKKLLNLIIEWPEISDVPNVKQIIAIFSVITVLLVKKDKSFKLDAKLIRPKV